MPHLTVATPGTSSGALARCTRSPVGAERAYDFGAVAAAGAAAEADGAERARADGVVAVAAAAGTAADLVEAAAVAVVELGALQAEQDLVGASSPSGLPRPNIEPMCEPSVAADHDRGCPRSAPMRLRGGQHLFARHRAGQLDLAGARRRRRLAERARLLRGGVAPLGASSLAGPSIGGGGGSCGRHEDEARERLLLHRIERRATPAKAGSSRRGRGTRRRRARRRRGRSRASSRCRGAIACRRGAATLATKNVAPPALTHARVPAASLCARATSGVSAPSMVELAGHAVGDAEHEVAGLVHAHQRVARLGHRGRVDGERRARIGADGIRARRREPSLGDRARQRPRAAARQSATATSTRAAQRHAAVGAHERHRRTASARRRRSARAARDERRPRRVVAHDVGDVDDGAVELRHHLDRLGAFDFDRVHARIDTEGVAKVPRVS